MNKCRSKLNKIFDLCKPKWIFIAIYGKLHSIHHCFGDVVDSFVIMNRQVHIDLHKKFGRFNENCLLTNEQVKEFIMNHEHILVENGIITENTME